MGKRIASARTDAVVRMTVQIYAPVAKVWRALTDPKQVSPCAPKTAVNVAGGWVGMLSALKTLAESGRLPWPHRGA